MMFLVVDGITTFINTSPIISNDKTSSCTSTDNMMKDTSNEFFVVVENRNEQEDHEVLVYIT